MTAIKKYLDKYSQPECRDLGSFPENYQRGLVVPVYREQSTIIERFSRFAERQAGTLLVFVVNRPDSDTNIKWCEKFYRVLDEHKCHWASESGLIALYTLQNNSGLLVVDRCLAGDPIPADQGVGTARKIGNDILCMLIAHNKIASSWLANTDADAQLPENYFSSQAMLKSSDAVAIYPFQHIFVDHLAALPTLLYEFSLHYYVAGLRWAGSAYAYHSIGSTVLINYQHYCRVRGFPKRPAGEDFYLLNKLVKTGALVQLEKAVIDIRARESSRVPFGTGPAVIKISALPNPLEMPIYHPDSFLYLRCFLALANSLAHNRRSIEAAAESLQSQSTDNIDWNVLREISAALNLDKALDHCHRHGDTSSKRLRHLTIWFDAFKTLKFIHILRDSLLGTMSFNDWMQHYQNSETLFDSQDIQGSIAKIKTAKTSPEPL